MGNSAQGEVVEMNVPCGGLLFGVEDDERRVPPRPLTDVVGPREVAPFIRGVADEMVGFARAQLGPDVGEELGKRIAAIEKGFTADCVIAQSRFIPESEYRALLVRIAAQSIALLALDEMVQGETATEKAMERLDERGFVVS